jgi:hypothetical protein
VALMWFWLISGIAYVSIGIFNCISAKRLRYIDVSRLDNISIEYSEETMKQLDKIAEDPHLLEQRLSTEPIKHELFIGGRIGWEDIQTIIQILRDLLNSIKSISKEFNQATDINRWVLVWAAVSFFIAAFISFYQASLN